MRNVIFNNVQQMNIFFISMVSIPKTNLESQVLYQASNKTTFFC
jgi:hypothetical protein